MQVREALHQARDVLAPVSESASTDARVLLADTLCASSTWLLAHEDDLLPVAVEQAFTDRIRRQAGGEPLPYVLGWWGFYGRRFSISPSVLIPRPETELLVDLALAELRRRGSAVRVIDIGTGSGCIAVSLAAETSQGTIVASDVSRQALKVARVNAVGHNVMARLRLVQSSLLEGLTGRWDVVCANLPYVPTGRLAELAVGRHEPRLALDGGRAGMDLTAKLIRSLRHCLAPAGLALLEIDEGQESELIALGRETLEDAESEVRLDLAGRPRLLVVRRRNSVA